LSTQKSSSGTTSTPGSTSSLTSKTTSTSTSTQPRTQTTNNQSTTSQTRTQTSASSNNNKSIVPFANVDAGIYVVFGSFKEKKNAEKMLSKLRKQYPNVVAMGNDNPVGMYRVAIGPYKTKEEAIAKKPQDIETWILKCGK